MIENENKASNRESYLRKKMHDNKQKKFAINQTLLFFQEELTYYEKNIKEICNCVDTEIPKGQKHQEKCPSLNCIENVWIKEEFRRDYIKHKTFNYYRDISPEYYFKNQIMKKEQTKKDKVGIFSKVVKGKYYKDDHLY